MKVNQLSPVPTMRETFKRSREKLIPPAAGCYVLSNFSGDVLYIGLAINLRRRFGQHLDNPDKTGETKNGRAVFFFWLEVNEMEINKIERTWLGIHTQNEGTLPILNKVFSPTST
jgi:excinuclease UvrABC nuclease subunit